MDGKTVNVLERSRKLFGELSPVLLVAVIVTLVGTITGSVLDHRHQIAADAQGTGTTWAVAGADQTQLLSFKDWGIQVSLPLVSELSLTGYSGQSASSRGLSSSELTKLGPQCDANNNALGTLMRYPAGTYAQAEKHALGENVLTTLGGYDYVYRFAQNSCVDSEIARVIVNRQESMLLDDLGSLSLINP
jgi:hypothetical protein